MPVLVKFESAPYVIAVVEAPPFGVIFDVVLKVILSLVLISIVLVPLFFLIVSIGFGVAFNW